MKRFRNLWGLALLAPLAAMLSGCGGFTGSHSVSPASFFLPGLMKNDVHQPAPGEPTPPTPAEVQAEPGSRAS